MNGGRNDLTKRTAALLVFGLLLLFVPGQAFGAERAAGRLDRGVQRQFTAEQGLLSTSSTAIAQTSDGFIWIGGYGGLVRYDGKEFLPYGAGQYSNITDLLPGEYGTLYIASVDQGLVMLRADRLTVLTRGDGVNAPALQCLAMSPSGDIWYGTDSGIGVYTVISGERRISCPDLDGKKVIEVCCVSDTEIFAVTQDGSLVRYDLKTGNSGKIVPGGAEKSVRSVARDESGEWYVGTSGRTVYRCDSEFNILEETDTGGLTNINYIGTDGDGSVWICADNGIGILGDGAVKAQNLAISNSVESMMTDAEGNYWFVSSRQGVLEVTDSRFVNLNRIARLDTMVVNAVTIEENRLYIGHDGGLVILDPNTLDIIRDRSFDLLTGKRIRCIFADSEGNLWFCLKDAGLLCRRKNKTWKVYSSSGFEAIGSDNFRCVTETENGIVAGSDSGAYYIRENAVEPVIREMEGSSGEEGTGRVLSIYSRGGDLYLGTDGSGLYLVRDGRVERHYTKKNGLRSNVVMKICEDGSTGDLWLVTGNEISCLGSGGTLSHLDGFPSSNNLDMIFTGDGSVWIPSGTGIFLTDENALHENRFDNIRQYRKKDGLPYEVTANSYQYQDGDIVYLCGAGGVMTLDSNSGRYGNRTYPITFDVVMDGEPVRLADGGSVTARRGLKRISIYPHVLTFGLENPVTGYLLEGFDDAETVRRNSALGEITYTNLDGGDYVFRFRTGNQEVSFRISKTLSMTETIWFRLAVAAGVLLIVLLIAAIVSRISSDREKRKMQLQIDEERKAYLEEIAYTDYLTGLYSRNYLGVWSEQELKDSDFPVSFIMVDCNGLKEVNDRFGHREGDLLLKKLSDMLKEVFVDPKFTVFRAGGDEFLVLGRRTGEDAAAKKLGELREAAGRYEAGGRPITFCAGICTMNAEEYDFDAGLGRSDAEMLKEKANYHGRRE